MVPRIPGGEITPEKLIVIGEVARDFQLYTKITGGQRIDLFGARVEQLPQIWRRLVDAGFESGHAYGKALRTVKSCVGETWCRYGVQDSVGLAVALELRYRGLRAPHKIKSAVSGCARECAEARSKDFGIIATETGWNLYVGGNGGFRPRHADLFATDLSTETLISLIDRFLIYYIRTADRLQRTAGWIEAMDGGLDHLRAVIVDDSLGLCAELDAAMAQHVSSYSDEWRDVLDDPDRLRRYTSFVNAPDVPDPSITFARERGQPVPVREHPGRIRAPSATGHPGPTGGTAMNLTTTLSWTAVCPLDRLEPDRGVAALVEGAQIALFRTEDGLFAIDNRDPVSGAYVLSRGIVGSRGGVPTVASPLHKQVYDLRSGHCLDLPGVAVARHDARCRDGLVEVRLRQEA